MALLKLRSRDREMLRTIVARPDNSMQIRRAQALLWLDAGQSVIDVAARLIVTRRTIYYWVTRFQIRLQFNIALRLSDGPRSGRPRTVHGVIDPLIDAVIDYDPRKFGYRSTVWTAGLLKQYLCHRHEISVSRRSVGLAIKRLRIRWKRPRHQLALRSQTWRQAKGGLNAGFSPANARSF